MQILIIVSLSKWIINAAALKMKRSGKSFCCCCCCCYPVFKRRRGWNHSVCAVYECMLIRPLALFFFIIQVSLAFFLLDDSSSQWKSVTVAIGPAAVAVQHLNGFPFGLSWPRCLFCCDALIAPSALVCPHQHWLRQWSGRPGRQTLNQPYWIDLGCLLLTWLCYCYWCSVPFHCHPGRSRNSHQHWWR